MDKLGAHTHMYQLPVSATDYHNLGDLKQYLFFHSSRGQKFKSVSLSYQKGHAPSRSSKVESLPCLFQPLMAGILCFVATSFQSPPHGHIAFFSSII